MGIYSQKSLAATVFILILSFPAIAGGDPRTRACSDGIGYRSNLIDPLNHYARPQYLMTTQLLERYGLIPPAYEAPADDQDDDPGSNNGSLITISSPTGKLKAVRLTKTDRAPDLSSLSQDDYVERVRAYLSEPDDYEVHKPFEKYHYAWGRCESNDVPSAAAYMEAAHKAIGKGQEADALIFARHRLLQVCEIDGEQAQKAHIREVFADLVTLNDRASTKDWVLYLEAAANFYLDADDLSEKMFRSLSKSDADWISDTADYLVVRMAKERVDQGDITATEDLTLAREYYLNRHPGGRYERTVLALDQYLARARSDHAKLYELQAAKFEDVFGPNSLVPIDQRESVLFDLMFGTNSGMITNPAPADLISSGKLHPILLTSLLLQHVSDDASHLELFWPQIIHRAREQMTLYPGLESYAELLVHMISGDYPAILAEEIDEATYGPLLLDALVLRARAYEKMDQKSAAIDTWTQVLKTTPTFNALTEIANQLVGDNRFEEFAYIPTQHTRAFSGTRDSVEQYCRDEFDIGVEGFLKTKDPFRNLLNEGFEHFVAVSDVHAVGDDDELHPLIRFYAVEPTLRSSLMYADYQGFIRASKFLRSESFASGLKELHPDVYQPAEMISGYTEAISLAERLIDDPEDADALTQLAYFRYSKHLIARCGAGDTLWTQMLDDYSCKGKHAAESVAVAPIEMFSRALRQYKKLPVRTAEEASLLRIMIYCFKGYSNRMNCALGDTEDYPEDVRKGYFNRLKSEFPSSEHVEYWY